MATGSRARRSAFRALVLATCLSGLFGDGPLQAANPVPSTDLPDISAIRAQIYSGDYEEAIKELLALTGSVQHADLYNLLGYSYRSLRQYDEAARWYEEALHYDPGHRAALEYQGELFIATGDFEGAETNLKYLRLLCGPQGCEELDQLQAALVEAGRTLPETAQ